jgi:hypothetical protein
LSANAVFVKFYILKKTTKSIQQFKNIRMKNNNGLKKMTFVLITGLMLLMTTQLNAQKYGDDVIINNKPLSDQRSPKLTIAFNGWMFASYFTYDTLSIYKSIDNGITWTYLADANGVGAFDMVVCGTTTANLTLFAAFYLPSINRVFVQNIDVNTETGYPSFYYFISGGSLLDLKIASDYKFPSAGASPYSVAVAFSIRAASGNDSLICWTSGNGGISFPYANKKTVDVTPNFFKNLSLCYGRSPSGSSGRYFIAYEQPNSGEVGQIKYSHTIAFFNDDFTIPQIIDTVGGASGNDCKNPVISCQADNSNNSVSGLTAVITFDRKYSATDYDVEYVYKYNAAVVSSPWDHAIIANSAAVETQADVVYDPVNHNFLATYYDQSTQKLLFKLNDINLSSWLVYNWGYNDSPALSNPYPQIDINPLYTKVAFVWCQDGSPATNGVIMYDGENSTNGISNNPVVGNDYNLYPNPASEFVTIKTSENADYSITLYNVAGQAILENTFSGNEYRVNLENIPQGYYIMKITSSNASSTEKLIVR